MRNVDEVESDAPWPGSFLCSEREIYTIIIIIQDEREAREE
jgi:hypothetical protein